MCAWRTSAPIAPPNATTPTTALGCVSEVNAYHENHPQRGTSRAKSARPFADQRTSASTSWMAMARAAGYRVAGPAASRCSAASPAATSRGKLTGGEARRGGGGLHRDPVLVALAVEVLGGVEVVVGVEVLVGVELRQRHRERRQPRAGPAPAARSGGKQGQAHRDRVLVGSSLTSVPRRLTIYSHAHAASRMGP